MRIVSISTVGGNACISLSLFTYMLKTTRRVIAMGEHSRAVIIPAVFSEMLELEVGTSVNMERVGTQIIIKKAQKGKE